MVREGTLSVAVDGRLRDHALRRGDGFGEIALLRRVARTATVTAVTDCELLELRSERFLAAVTSCPNGSVLAAELTAAHMAADRAAG